MRLKRAFPPPPVAQPVVGLVSKNDDDLDAIHIGTVPRAPLSPRLTRTTP
jgi:hypothetical protein